VKKKRFHFLPSKYSSRVSFCVHSNLHYKETTDKFPNTLTELNHCV